MKAYDKPIAAGITLALGVTLAHSSVTAFQDIGGFERFLQTFSDIYTAYAVDGKIVTAPLDAYAGELSHTTFLSLLDKANTVGSSAMALLQKETYDGIKPVIDKLTTGNIVFDSALFAVGGGVIAKKSRDLVKGALGLVHSCRDYYKAYFSEGSAPYYHRIHDQIVNGFGKPEEIEACKERAAKTLAGLIAYNRDPENPEIMPSDMGYTRNLFASLTIEEMFDKIEAKAAEAENVREKLYTGAPSDSYTPTHLGKLRDFRREIVMDNLPDDVTNPFDQAEPDQGPSPEDQPEAQ